MSSDLNDAQRNSDLSVEEIKRELEKLPPNERVQKAVGDMGLELHVRIYHIMGTPTEFRGFQLNTRPTKVKGRRGEGVSVIPKEDIELSGEHQQLLDLNQKLHDQLLHKRDEIRETISTKCRAMASGRFEWAKRFLHKFQLDDLNRSNLELLNHADVTALAISLEERIYGSSIGQYPALSEEEIQKEYEALEVVIDRVTSSLGLSSTPFVGHRF